MELRKMIFNPMATIQNGPYNSLLPRIILLNPQPYTMSELKKMVRELFEQDHRIHAIEKDIKVRKAQYHHLILKNPEKIYSDEDIMAVHVLCEELANLEKEKSLFQTRINEIKNFLKSRLVPLNGGRWIHETDDQANPKWEFWVENEELKYARLRA